MANTRYILYLTPTTDSLLYHKVNDIYDYQDKFFNKKYRTIYPPHITLTSFFTLPSKKLIKDILENISKFFDESTVLKIEREMTMRYSITDKWMGLDVYSDTLMNKLGSFVEKYPFMKSEALKVNHGHLTLVNNYEFKDITLLHSINSIHLKKLSNDNTFEIMLWTLKLENNKLTPY